MCLICKWEYWASDVGTELQIKDSPIIHRIVHVGSKLSKPLKAKFIMESTLKY